MQGVFFGKIFQRLGDFQNLWEQNSQRNQKSVNFPKISRFKACLIAWFREGSIFASKILWQIFSKIFKVKTLVDSDCIYFKINSCHSKILKILNRPTIMSLSIYFWNFYLKPTNFNPFITFLNLWNENIGYTLNEIKESTIFTSNDLLWNVWCFFVSLFVT